MYILYIYSRKDDEKQSKQIEILRQYDSTKYCLLSVL